MTRATRTLLIPLVAATLAHAGPRDRNFLRNPGFEAQEGELAAHWEPAGEGYELALGEGRNGGACLHFASDDDQRILGARQVIEFDPPVEHPIALSGWSRCRQATGIDYCVWLDVHYADGTPLWGQRAEFTHGSHGWERAEFVFTPAKPVASIEAFVLFRGMTGEAWVDDVRVGLALFDFERVRAIGGLTGPGSVEVQAAVNMPARWRIELFRDGSVIAAETGEGRSQRVSFAPELPAGPAQVRIAATDTALGERITRVVNVNTRGPAGEFGLWTESSMTRVMPVDLPTTSPPATSIDLLAARNEYESAQIVLLPGADEKLRGVRLETPDLQGPDGPKIPAENLQWRQVGYVWIEEQTSRPDVPTYAPTWWPDPLLPVERFDVEPGWSQPAWVTVYVPAGTPPGTYSGEIRVLADNAEARSVPITVRVIDCQLPLAGRARNAFALHRGFLEKIYGQDRVAEDRALRWAYGDYLLQHRINPDDITRNQPPMVEDIEHYAERGLTTYNLIDMVEARGDSPLLVWSPLEAYLGERGRRLKQRVIDLVDPVVEKLRDRDLLDGAYVYTFDERGEDFYPVVREYFGMVHERWGVPTFTTAKVPQDPEVLRDLNVDWLCPHWRFYDFEKAERCREAGHQVWSYTCCGPRYPFSNILADDPLICSRIIGWQMYHQKLDGFLFWGVNVWSRRNNDAPIDLSEGPRLDWSITTGGERWARLHGDGVLLYPLPDGPMGCIRLANIRDGFEDYEYLYALGSAQGEPYRARELCEPVTTSLSSYTLDPQVVLDRRRLIAEKLTGGVTR